MPQRIPRECCPAEKTLEMSARPVRLPRLEVTTHRPLFAEKRAKRTRPRPVKSTERASIIYGQSFRTSYVSQPRISYVCTWHVAAQEELSLHRLILGVFSRSVHQWNRDTSIRGTCHFHVALCFRQIWGAPVKRGLCVRHERTCGSHEVWLHLIFGMSWVWRGNSAHVSRRLCAMMAHERNRSV